MTLSYLGYESKWSKKYKIFKRKLSCKDSTVALKFSTTEIFRKNKPILMSRRPLLGFVVPPATVGNHYLSLWMDGGSTNYFTAQITRLLSRAFSIDR